MFVDVHSTYNSLHYATPYRLSTGLISGLHKGRLLIGHIQYTHLSRNKHGSKIVTVGRHTRRLHIKYIQDGNRWDTYMVDAMRRQEVGVQIVRSWRHTVCVLMLPQGNVMAQVMTLFS